MISLPILAQAAPGVDLFGLVVPMFAVFGVFYFFVLRPQQAKQKEFENKIAAIKKGDTVVSNGGLIGKVIRVVDDKELLVEIGQNVQVRLLRQGIADVRPQG